MAELDSQPKTVQSLYAWFAEHKLSVNRRYQRKLVWTQVEKQKLVESVLRRFPVPAILLAEREDGYEIIDGLQRLHTLVSFVEAAFPTLGGHFFDVTQHRTAQNRVDAGDFVPVNTDDDPVLTPQEISSFLDYSMAISIMRGATEDEIDDVFGRINTYGHRLSDQERRQAGVQNEFSNLIRELACEIRGDASTDILDLSRMPTISIDLPMTRHGYDVVAEEVFWSRQGILRSTDLRDSMDEQCLADIVASIINGRMIDRSKDALDKVYDSESDENAATIAALDVYGKDKVASEVKYCIDELLKVCEAGAPSKLRNLISESASKNPFPSAFAVILVAIHESLIKGDSRIADYAGAKEALRGIYGRIETSRKSTSPDEREKNVNTVKGLLAPNLVRGQVDDIYGAHSTTDIDSVIRRSEIELPHYELKQGMLRLEDSKAVDDSVPERVVRTICAIANNGKGRSGTVVIGVTDKEADRKRVEKLYGIQPLKVGSRYVVGVKREADALGETTEAYFGRWKNRIRNSALTPALRDAVLSSIDYNDYYGRGVIVIKVPPQTEVSYVDDKPYWRDGDETKEAKTAAKIVELSKRFM